MLKYLAGIAALIALVLIAPYAFIGSSVIYPEALPQPAAPHAYANPQKPLDTIGVFAVYFVPSNKKDAAIENWQPLLEQELRRLNEFHRIQFLGRSKLVTAIYPAPVIGERKSTAYDTDITQHGNPAALKAVVSELERRVVEPSGDQYLPDVIPSDTSHQVLIVLYEGVGASGTEGAALLSRFFLTGEEYAPFRTTFLAHEFYHALGAPDRYTVAIRTFPDGQSASTEILASKDIMGIVRTPIERTYLDVQTLRQFGL